MKIKDIEKHISILVLLAKGDNPLMAEVVKITKKQITFKIDDSVTMRVDYTDTNPDVVTGNIIAIDFATNIITSVVTETEVGHFKDKSSESSARNSSLGCSDVNDVRDSFGPF